MLPLILADSLQLIVSRVLEMPTPTPIIDQIAQLVREKGLGTNHQVLKVIDMLFYGHAGGEEQQKEAGTQTIGRLEEAGTQAEAGHPEDVGTRTEAGDPKEAARQTETEQQTQSYAPQNQAGEKEQAQDGTNADDKGWCK